MTTRGKFLESAIAYGLRNVRTRQHRLGLSEDMRMDAARQAITALRYAGGWTDLDLQALPVHYNGPYAPPLPPSQRAGWAKHYATLLRGMMLVSIGLRITR